ncbi:nuclear transport factor 2 family protein [Robertkochia sediminum]|uniref:nuclear transport factor 2 family protein n=1 Tax=Robertkochia sediminum TaxID=2785326 RepID=UPI001933B0F2|nr:nuclear transport factor 2 family protein [Robertkochia sediminum]MBL7473554.1 nuclear transport factor 2 family protein [Robertkochia sediminum]
MSETTKSIVERFYSWDTKEDLDTIKEVLHDDIVLNWNSTKGFKKYGKDQILELISQLKQEYRQVRSEFTHMICEENKAAVRLTYFVEPFEAPEEEMPLVHFMAIWETKDGKLYRGYEMSHLADEHPENLLSFSRLPEPEEI